MFCFFALLLWPLLAASPAAAERRRDYAKRFRLVVRSSHEIFFYEPVVSATVVNVRTASVKVRDGHTVVVRGLAPGETLLVVSTRRGRTVYSVGVARPHAVVAQKSAAPKPAASKSAEPNSAEPKTTATPTPTPTPERPEAYTGTYAVTLSPATTGAPTLLRHAFDFNRKYEGGRVFRAGADLSQFFGPGNRGFGRPLDMSVGADRLALGLDTNAGTLDMLDSDLNLSPMGLQGFRLRGPHLVSRAASALRGAEVFAGVARPAPAFFDGGEGRLVGVAVPLVSERAWRARGGAVWVSPRRESPEEGGGLVYQTDVRYAPDKRLNAEAEAAYASGGLSVRARFDAQAADFKLNGEALSVDEDSPYVSIGAQPGGRSVTSLGVRWQHWQRLTANASVRRTTTESPSELRRAPLDGSILNAGADLKAAHGAHFSFGLTRQQLETPVRAGSDFTWQLLTTAATFKYSQQLGHGFANEFETRLALNGEAAAGAHVGRGFQLREQLRFNWRSGNVTGYLHQHDDTPSLAGLLIRNPSLLPAAAREVFEADPVGFLITNRHLLPQLLPGAELPLTRGREVGTRFQTRYARFDFNGETRYGVGQFSAQERRDLYVNAGVSARLDAANSLQVGGARLFGREGGAGQTSLTVTLVHRFGTAGGGGWSLAKLLGLERDRGD